ncbi:MAG: carboxylesterase family protein, partial [Myxococcota bacterium]
IGSFASPADAYRAAIEDLRFVCPQARAVTSLTSQGSNAYLYHFVNNPNPIFNLRSFHGLELFYVFATLGTQSLFTPDAGDFALSTAMQDAWTSFAETATPWTSPAWPLATQNPLTTPLLLWDANSIATANSTSTADTIRAGRCTALDALNLNPDLDLVWGSADNCPLHPNSLQGDADGDGVGDACDGPNVSTSSRWGLVVLVAGMIVLSMYALAAAPRARAHH